MSTIYVLQLAGIRRALLVGRTTDSRGRARCKVRLAGASRAVTLDARLVYDTEAAAQAAWRRARAHQAALQRAGARVRVMDAHLSLSYALEVMS